MSSALSPEACAAAWRDYGHLVRRRCRAMLRDDALGDDALQDTFVKLLRYGAEFVHAEAPLRFLYRIADRCCFQVMERRNAWREVAPPDDWQQTPAPGIDPTLRGAILRFIHLLSPEARTLAVLVFVDGLSQGEAADELGVSRVTINKRVQVLRQRAEAVLRGETPIRGEEGEP